MTTFRAALLDLDGTLLDSIPDLAMAANAMRVELGMEVLREDVIATFVGKGVDNLVRRTLAASLAASQSDSECDESLFQRARESFYRHYHLVNGDKARIFDGVLDGLKAMRELGLKLAVVTNKPTEFTLPLLQRTGLAGFFQAVVCGDTCARKKPDPQPVQHACALLDVAPEYAVTIGDSLNDTQAGRGAGTRTLVVPYGYNEGVDVRTLEVDGIVATLVEAADWIARDGAVLKTA
ncbi:MULTISPECIES: phosphoglycolate phosphatase [unclassified Achromobacter]|uniref:phosphoglycolate phosphatase n=1 Tax=unclassified Achromobacter TaxID=2626865 RepID=UPI000B51957F|nr:MULTISPECIES: phosphoglycolate phosphatase [unclassified Achromobacter]OWT75750.1 phosphoglycolate phosphatase [Achromobacter sp. HZ28]OWT76410.1 phosphoglycolate phosphatase [Achromobacter sp. HZ34]